jgi:hypothetical protein
MKFDHSQLVPKSRKLGSMHPLPTAHTPSLVEHRDHGLFTFIPFICQNFSHSTEWKCKHIKISTEINTEFSSFIIELRFKNWRNLPSHNFSINHHYIR